MAYAVKYRKRFQNYDSVTYRVDILNEAGGGIITPDKLSIDPGQLRTLGAGKDEYKIILGSEFAFDFILDGRVNESDYDALFESEYGEHIVKFYNHDTSTLLWQGYLQPENSFKDVHHRNLHMSFSATDALRDLSDYEFTDDGDLIIGHLTGLEIIKYCVANLDRDAQFQYDFVIKLGTKHTGEGVNDCALKDVTHDCRRFFKSKDGNTEIDDCATVIEKVLQPYHCQLQQYRGKYYIRHRYEGDTDYYTYNWALVFQNKTNANESVDIDSYNYRRDTESSLISPIKQMTIKLLNRNMGDALVADLNDFSGAGPWDFSGYGLRDGINPGVVAEDGNTLLHCYITDENAGNRIITLTNNISLNKVTNGDYIKLKFNNYADVEAHHASELPKMRITVNKPGGISETTWDSYFDYPNWGIYESSNDNVFKIIADGDYNIEIELIESDTAGADYEEEVYIKDVELVKISVVEEDTYSDISFDEFYRATSNKGKKIEETIEIYFGDTIGTGDLAALIYSGANTDEWDREGQNDNESLQYLYALDYLSDKQDYRKYIIIDVYDPNDNITPINFISFDGNTYTIASYEKSYRTSWCQLHLRQRITTGDATIVFSIMPLTSIDGESAVTYTVQQSTPSSSIIIEGTPTDNQVAVFTAADAIEGDDGLTYDKATGTLAVDIINEATAGSGVTIESVELKDGGITLLAGETVNDIESTIHDDDTHIPTSGAVIDYVTGLGYVDTSGVPANDQIAVFTDADTIEGSQYFQYDQTNYTLILDCPNGDESYLQLKVNTNIEFQIQVSSSSINIKGDNLFLSAYNDDAACVGIGGLIQVNTFLTIQDQDSVTPMIHVMTVFDTSTNEIFDVTSDSNVHIPNGWLYFGTSDELGIRYSGGTSYITSTSHGDIVVIQGEDTGGIMRSLFVADPDSNARMFYGGSEKIKTQSWGASITGTIYISKDMIMIEAADHTSTPSAGIGILWVRNDAPCTLVFTDDTGVDHDLT